MQFKLIMSIIHTEGRTNYEQDIKNACDTLNNSGVILYPTDTIWGLGCDAFDMQAIQKIYSIKNRPIEKSMLVLLADARDIIKYIPAPHPDIIDIVGSFAQPTTVIYDNALEFPEDLLHANGSIGIRVTTDPFCKALIKRFGKPIVSTSANISGAPSAAIFDEIDEQIINNVDYTVRYRQDDTTTTPASRIVKITDDGSLDIIRG